MENVQRYSQTYRAAEMMRVMGWIRAGQCGSIIGLSGSGKSNFIRFLLDIETQKYYLGQEQSNFTFVLIDLLSLVERSEWGVYEMILTNLLVQLHGSGAAVENISQVKTLHEEIMRGRDALIAKQAIEHCVALLCQEPTQRIVFLLDEFDAVFRELPASLFRGLRAIRDSYKDQLSYISVTTHDLVDLRNDLADEMDHFYRLISRNPCWLGPYSEADALQMMHYLCSRRGQELARKETIHLFALSGGHSSLLKAILSLVWNGFDPRSLAKPPATLIKEPAIERECQKIWDSLSKDEKAALCSFSNNNPPNERMLNHLTGRGLLRRKGASAWDIFSPLVASFVQGQAPPPEVGFYLSLPLQVVQIDGQPIKLTDREFKFLAYLYKHRGRVCTKREIIDHVYDLRYDSGSYEMLQTLVSRLRKKIDPDPDHARYIDTVRGDGYRFISPDE